MPATYLIDGGRSPLGRFGGGLSTLHPRLMACQLIKVLLERQEIPPGDVDEVILGCVLQAGLGQNVARQAALLAAIPVEKPASTVNIVCGSGLLSLIQSARAIRAGDIHLALAGGVENMSGAPYLLPGARAGFRLGDQTLKDAVLSDGLHDALGDYHMGMTAENLADRYKISRKNQDVFALSSQKKALEARKNGRFMEEIIPSALPLYKGKQEKIAQDENIREDSNIQDLAKLKTVFKEGGTVTAGNASGLSDGAAAVLLASEGYIKKHQHPPLARLVSYAITGCEPETMGLGPVNAVRKALKNAEWSLDDLDLIEANEAFAAQSLAVEKELQWNPDIVNVNGGAIALGHPIGASGARIVVTLLYEMQRRAVKKGLATLCVGGGMGLAICVERE